jgi:hypothetical protein
MDERGKSAADWRLERLAQGELDEKEAQSLEQKLGRDGLKQKLADLEASNRDILERLPPEAVAASIQRRRPARTPSRARWVMVALPLAMAAGVWALAPRLASSPQPPDGYLGIKGATRLYAYRAAANGKKPARLGQGARVRPHDALQLAYTAGQARFGIIVSVDGRGVVTQHLPVDTSAPAALNPAGEVSLPRSYELDDAPGFERFFFITAGRGFSVAEVLDAARALARNPDEARRKSLPLAAELSQESLLLEKVQP